MQATTGQNNSRNMIILRHQEPVVSMFTTVENPIIRFRPILIQSIAGQFCENCTIIITHTFVQLISAQGSLFNILAMCIMKISREQFRYILLIPASIALTLCSQIGRIME